MAFPPPPPPATEKDESPENNDGNMGITSFEKQLCEKTIKATREKCKVEIEKQTQELKNEKKQFWAEKGTVAELKHKYELSKAEKEGLKAENNALTEHNMKLLELNNSLLEKLYEKLDDSRSPKRDVEHKEQGTQTKIVTIPLKRQHEDEEPGPAGGPPRHRITLSFSLGKDKSGGSGEREA